MTGIARTKATKDIHMIAYLSDVAVPDDRLDAEIDNIVRTAKRENNERRITGVLFHVEKRFLQVIEARKSISAS